ncbi:hypothetical protein BH11BAC1_BH11BAC1_27890 [soil metagenome]
MFVVCFLYSKNREDAEDKWSLLSGATHVTLAKSLTIETKYAQANAANEIQIQLSISNGLIEIPLDDSHPNVQTEVSIQIKSVCNKSLKFITIPMMVRFQLTKKKLKWYANEGI